MATLTTITTTVPVKDAPCFAPMPATKQFTHLLGALTVYIEAERDLDHVDCWDPAFMEWHRDAEQARETVLTHIAEICSTEAMRIEDLPLKRLALLTRGMIHSADAAEFMQLHGLVAGYPDLFRCAADGAVSQRVNAMLQRATALLDDLATLAEYIDIAPEAVILGGEEFLSLAM